jgi:hypothetical protein
MQSARQQVLVCFHEHDMRRAISAPSARNRKKHIRLLLDKLRLHLWCNHQVPVALALCGQRRKDPAANSEIRRAHVRTLFRTLQAQSQPPKVRDLHSFRTLHGIEYPTKRPSTAVPNQTSGYYNINMLKLFFPGSPKSQFRGLIALSAALLLSLSSFSAHAQDTEKRGRKYQPPPPTARVSVAVIKDTNGKPIENAAVVFHLSGEEGKGNMEMKTNEEGKAVIDVVPIGDTMRLQIIANGFQTFGQDYKIDTDSKDITVRLKRPQQQYSTYEHAASGNTSGSQSSAPQQNTPQAPPKQ